MPSINAAYDSLAERYQPKLARIKASGPAVRVYRFSVLLFLMEVLLCTVPSAILLGRGKANAAGLCFWGMLALMIMLAVMMGRRDKLLCLLLGVAPFISLLRGGVFYNVVIALFGGALFYYAIGAPGRLFEMVKRFPLLLALFAYAAIYYALSFFNTGDYSSNLRLFEFALTATLIVVVSRKPVLLASALLGLMMSAWFVGLAMLPYIRAGETSRLGVIRIDGQSLGNPTQLGIPLAFGFLALIIDRGWWLQMRSRSSLRLSMLLPTLPLLALTTSRSSWLVASGGLLIGMLLSARQRLKMFLIVGVCAVAVQAVLLSPFGQSLQKGLDRTFDDSRSTRSRTSGRSDQWKVAGYVFQRSVDTMLHGYGPGMGPTVYAKYSGELPEVKYGVGKKVALHSLFMQIMVETGLIGLLLLGVGLGIIFYKICRSLRPGEKVFPLICFFGYVFIVVTVSGSDINSGVFLGMALLGTAQIGTMTKTSTLSAGRAAVSAN